MAMFHVFDVYEIGSEDERFFCISMNLCAACRQRRSTDASHDLHDTGMAARMCDDCGETDGAEYECESCMDRGCPECDEFMRDEAELVAWCERRGVHHPDCICNACRGFGREY